VAKAVTQSGSKVEGLGAKLDSLALAMGDTARLSDRVLKVEERLKAVEDGRPSQVPSTDGTSYTPPGGLSEPQLLCLRALTQIDAQLVDKQATPDELTEHLHSKSTETLGQTALGLLQEIGEDRFWGLLCAPVQNRSEVPARVALSYYLRGVVLRSATLNEKASGLG
jgi:hypothetical protein